MDTLTAEPIPARRRNPYEPNPALLIWIDGALLPPGEAKISVFDHALLYGDGVFEGIRVYHGKIFKEAEHIRRLFESAKALRIDFGMTPQQVSAAMHETIEANDVADGYIRLVVTRGVGSLGISTKHTACPSVIIIAGTIQLYPPELYQAGLKCVISSYLRTNPNSLSPRVKSLNYLNNIMAKLEAQDAGAHEAVMLNDEGHVAECTGDNIFLIRNGELQTPPACAGILEGVTRGLVMALARGLGFTVREAELIRHDLYVADEIFLTGTAAEIIGVVSVDNRIVGDGKPGPITRRLAAEFARYRNEY